MNAFFKVDRTTGVSKFRFWLLRIFYAMIIVLLGFEAWTEVFTHKEMWQPLPAVAYSFWAAFSFLAILGILHPLKMVPLLLVQFFYKLIWLIIVAYPLWVESKLAGSAAHGLTEANAVGIIIDLLVIPWPHVFKEYVSIKKKI